MATQKEKIVIIGFGWVGQANALSLIKMGYDVSVFDPGNPDHHYRDEYEAEYSSLKHLKSALEDDSENTWYILTVGDKVLEDGYQDISLIEKASDSLKNAKGKVILRSTILPESLGKLSFDIYFPEFLHEKFAVDECLNPHFFVLGMHNEIELPSFLKDWERKAYRVFRGTPQDASYIKYLSNVWNSVKIAFVNEFGDGIERPTSPEAIQRIENITNFVFEGESYLKYGKAFKGHCLPKDVRAFMTAYKKEGKNSALLHGVYESNTIHEKLENEVGNLPEWYSFWGTRGASGSLVSKSYETLNSLGIVKKARRKLRFIVDAINSFVPDRSMEKVKQIWEKKAHVDANRYSNLDRKAGKEVIHTELDVTGEEDVKKYIELDQTIQKNIPDFSTKRVLDYGSGIGRVACVLSDKFKEVYAFDISPKMIECSGERLADKSNVFALEVDGVVIPVKDETIDLVFSKQTLRYIPTKDTMTQTLDEMNRVLVKGGIAKLQFGTGRGSKKWQWHHGVTFTLEDAMKIAEDSGFSVKEHTVEDIDSLWLTLQKV